MNEFDHRVVNAEVESAADEFAGVVSRITGARPRG